MVARTTPAGSNAVGCIADFVVRILMFCDRAALGILREITCGFGDRPAQQQPEKQHEETGWRLFVRPNYFVHRCWCIGEAEKIISMKWLGTWLNVRQFECIRRGYRKRYTTEPEREMVANQGFEPRTNGL